MIKIAQIRVFLTYIAATVGNFIGFMLDGARNPQALAQNELLLTAVYFVCFGIVYYGTKEK